MLLFLQKVVTTQLQAIPNTFLTLLDGFGFGSFSEVSDCFQTVSDGFKRSRTVTDFRTVSDRFRTVSDGFRYRFRTISDRFQSRADRFRTILFLVKKTSNFICRRYDEKKRWMYFRWKRYWD